MTGYGFDHYQRITNVHFGIATKFKFTAGDTHGILTAVHYPQGYFDEFYFSDPSSFSSGPLTQETGTPGGAGVYLHGSDDHDPMDPDYFAAGRIEFSLYNSTLLTRQLEWQPPFPASITGTDVWELTIPGLPRTFRTDDADFNGTIQWAPLSSAYTFTAGSQYDCTWIQVA